MVEDITNLVSTCVATKDIYETIDKIKEKGYKINVFEKRPLNNVINLSTLSLDTNSEFENLKANLSELVFYKSDKLEDSRFKLKQYLEKIERLEYIKLNGEYSKEIEDIAKYILK